MPIARRAACAAFATISAITLAGCHVSRPSLEDLGQPPHAASLTAQPRDYALVFIMTGPLRQPTREQQEQAMQGHFANMQRMAADGSLLIAGPLVDPRSNPNHRGIFVFDADTADKGLALANTDPAAEMGVFVMQPFVLTTEAPLTELTRLEAEYEQRRFGDPDVPDEWVGRMYVLASAPYDPTLHEQVRRADGVLLAGRLTSERGDDRLLLWLDAPNAQLGRALLPAPAQGDWTMHGWYGSPTIGELPGANPAS